MAEAVEYANGVRTRLTLVEHQITGLDTRLTVVADRLHEMDIKNAEHGEMLLRINQLETKIDELPGRVSNLEKYGSDVTIRLPEQIKDNTQRLQRLEKKPKKRQEAEARRQNRALMWAGVISALAVVLSLGCSLVGLGVSIWLANH